MNITKTIASNTVACISSIAQSSIIKCIRPFLQHAWLKYLSFSQHKFEIQASTDLAIYDLIESHTLIHIAINVINENNLFGCHVKDLKEKIRSAPISDDLQVVLDSLQLFSELGLLLNSYRLRNIITSPEIVAIRDALVADLSIHRDIAVIICYRGEADAAFESAMKSYGQPATNTTAELSSVGISTTSTLTEASYQRNNAFRQASLAYRKVVVLSHQVLIGLSKSGDFANHQIVLTNFEFCLNKMKECFHSIEQNLIPEHFSGHEFHHRESSSVSSGSTDVSMSSMEHSLTIQDCYDSADVIGSGGFSSVYLVKSKNSGQTYAAKQISTKKLSGQHLSKCVNVFNVIVNKCFLSVVNLHREIAIMKELDHPRIVKVKEVFIEADYVYIIMNYYESKFVTMYS